MRRAAIVVILAVIGCSRPETRADSTVVGTTAGASASAIPSGSTSSARPGPTGGDVPPSTAAILPGGGSTGTAPTGDIIVGKVGEHGFDPETFLAITPAGGAQTRLSGAQLGALGAVKGAEVWARGKKEGNAFRVDTFEVRRANDQEVVDGIVSVSGTTVTVRTARGALTYPEAPSILRNAAGARVWITPPVKGQAPSFGVIRAN